MTLATLLVLAAAPWTLPELEAASAQGAAAEVLERCEDVPPAQRSTAWRAVVAEAAVTVVSSMKAQPTDPFTPAQRAASLQTRYPFLADGKRFVAARDAAAVASLQRCVRGGATDCLDRVAPLVEGLSREASLELARALRAAHPAHHAMSLVRRAVAGADRPATACADPLVGEVTLSALTQPEDSDFALDARRVAFDVCFQQLRPALVKAMVGAPPELLRNCCEAMRARKALTTLQDALCRDEGR